MTVFFKKEYSLVDIISVVKRDIAVWRFWWPDFGGTSITKSLAVVRVEVIMDGGCVYRGKGQGEKRKERG